MVTERPGDGKTFPKKGDMLTMHYHGSLAATGAKFDASYDRGAPFKFQIGVGQVDFPSCLFSLTQHLPSPLLPLSPFRNEQAPYYQMWKGTPCIFLATRMEHLLKWPARPAGDQGLG